MESQCGEKKLQKKRLPVYSLGLFSLNIRLQLVSCFVFSFSSHILDRIRQYDDASFRWLQRSKVLAILKVKNVLQLSFSSYRNFGKKITEFKLPLSSLSSEKQHSMRYLNQEKKATTIIVSFPTLAFYFFSNIFFRQSIFLRSKENKRTKELFRLICSKVRVLNKVRKVISALSQFLSKK